MAIATVVSILAERRHSPDEVVQVQASGSPTATPTVDMPTPTAVLPGALPEAAIGLRYPIEGACLPEDERLYPEARRDYRGGVHEGLDFYDADNCVMIGLDTEVVAVATGTVLRVDRQYDDLKAADLRRLDLLILGGQADDPEVVDAFRGRQVWIAHGDGVVTRYAHLNGVADGLRKGDRALAGELIGYVGESGTPESVTDPGREVHLHFELRIGDTYLGQGESVRDVRRLYQEAFAEDE